MPARFIPTQKQSDQILALYEQGLGAKKVAKLLFITRDQVISVCKQLNIYDSNRKLKILGKYLLNKVCILCNEHKYIMSFKRYQDKKTGLISYDSYCSSCTIAKRKQRYEANAEINREYARNYRESNKPVINKRARQQRKNDSVATLRGAISGQIRRMLVDNASSKNGASCLKYLPYTIIELKAHLQSLFEPWMTWNNRGPYKRAEWDDNDSSTWKWQLDHKIPQSDLPYDSMEHPNFQKCWALENLRPYSAKLNLVEGTRRIRHATKQ